MSAPLLPTVNAAFNATAAACLLAGYAAVKRKNIPLHRLCMGLAFLSSVAFLAGYVVYHFTAGMTRFQGTGALRAFYLGILLTHTVLAVAVPPLVLTTLALALRGRFDRHRAWARWTWPVWMYVSVTGVMVYALLYHL